MAKIGDWASRTELSAHGLAHDLGLLLLQKKRKNVSTTCKILWWVAEGNGFSSGGVCAAMTQTHGMELGKHRVCQWLPAVVEVAAQISRIVVWVWGSEGSWRGWAVEVRFSTAGVHRGDAPNGTVGRQAGCRQREEYRGSWMADQNQPPFFFGL